MHQESNMSSQDPTKELFDFVYDEYDIDDGTAIDPSEMKEDAFFRNRKPGRFIFRPYHRGPVNWNEGW